MAAEYPGKRVEFKRSIAEGHFVVLHCHQIWPAGLKSRASTSSAWIRTAKWSSTGDVLQVIPEESANDNGML